ncbi:MAG: NAD(+) diphosphatase [Hyphomicrobiales bacterium]|nr:NAD(+) diphosphatase [Hyphomicrobiales bacterium]
MTHARFAAFRAPTVGPQISLDRAADKRRDPAWLAEATASPAARFAAFWDLKLAVQSSPDRSRVAIRLLSRDEIAATGADPDNAAFLLGLESGAPRFAAPLLTPADNLTFVDLRTLALQGAMPSQDLALAAQARALLAWRSNSRCCGRCGGAVVHREGGWRAACSSCGLEVYPRSDPAVIMIIVAGDRFLIARDVRFPENFHSVLAGFVEPGDDIETAVRRETMEETGVRVGAVHYLGSQPWPFPHTLMIGCWGEALTTDLRIDPEEIAAARWVGREEAAAMLAARHPDGHTLPGPLSMAHSLIRAFLAG